MFNTQLGKPVAQPADNLSTPSPGCRFRVTALVDEHLGVFGNIWNDVGLGDLFTYRLTAPDVLGSPVPPFPAVRVPGLVGVTSQEPEQFTAATVGGVHDLGLSVSVTLCQYGGGPVFLDDTLDLADNDIGGLIPGDSLVLALPPVLRVSLAVGVPVNPLERVHGPVWRVNAVLVGQGERWYQ